AVPGLDAGSHTVAASCATQGNYAASFQNGTLPVTRANQTIGWSSPAAIVYGTALSGAQLNASVAVVGPAAAGAITYSSVAGTVLHAGLGQVLTVSAAATLDYNAASATVTLDVTPAPLTVQAQVVSRAYGVTNPAFAVSYTGFVN